MCGIDGVFNLPKAAEITAIKLHVLQHRAVDGVGIVSSNGERLFRERGLGEVRETMTGDKLHSLHGMAAIGHIRYATSGNDDDEDDEEQAKARALDDIQPIEGQYNGRQIALAHNGNIYNTNELRQRYPDLRLVSRTDSEYIVRILEREQTGDIVADLKRILPMFKGSYALLIITPDKLIAVRDPTGNRPLSMGRLGDSYFFASETCAFSNVAAQFVRDVDSGTIVVIDESGEHTTRYAERAEKKCRFEGIYLSSPASVVFGEPVSDLRIRIGRTLETLFPVEADHVFGIPDSGNFYAMGFAESGRSGTF
jgi:amidophosphoribosyltransferase